MSKSMIEPSVEKQFLLWLHKDYTRRFGYGVRNIDKCDFYTTYSVENLPEEFYEINNGMARSHVLEYAKELEAKGLLRFAENGLKFHFTKEGYEAVSASKCQRFLDALNRNPGALALAAAIVSVGSLIVAILALRNGP
ncbi:hypothetical protein [Oceanospirillum linum]|uniref:hypothetical protein n=1 Tax=Oceanospirillum linum TaxID=966 RepID=UPI001116E1B0|nr:hypothetical protein [Oceanospirillum linum]